MLHKSNSKLNVGMTAKEKNIISHYARTYYGINDLSSFLRFCAINMVKKAKAEIKLKESSNMPNVSPV